MKIVIPTARLIASLNEKILKQKNTLIEGKSVESVLHSVFYPGEPLFQHGGIRSLAAVLAYGIVKGHLFKDGNKRTALAVSTIFLRQHGWQLVYPKGPPTALTRKLEEVAESDPANIDQVRSDLKKWYKSHCQRLLYRETVEIAEDGSVQYELK